MKVLTVKKVFSVGIGALLLSQSALMPMAEASIWDDRKQTVKPIQLASLPNKLSTPLLNHLPSIKNTFPSLSKWKKVISPKLAPLIEAIPQTHSRIEKIYEAPSSTNQTVILIQDVHLNPEAQSNIAAVIQSLIDQDQVDLVGVEGAFDQLDFSHFRNSPEKNIVEKVARAFLEAQHVAAPSYVGLTSKKDIPLFMGIDDADHHKANVEAYLQAQRSKPKIQKDLQALSSKTQALKKQILNRKLAEFDDLKSAYHTQSIGIGIYLKRLSAYPADLDFTIEKFLQAYQLETNLDFSRVDQQRKRVIERLSHKLDKNAMSDLFNRSMAYKMGRIGFGDYYQHIKDLCEQNKIDLKQTPAFDDYIRYVLLSDSINVNELFSSMHKLEQQVQKNLIQTNEEQLWLEQSDHIRITEKLINFELTPMEWEKYKKVRGARNMMSRHPDESQDPQNRSGSRIKSGMTMDLSSFEQFYIEAQIRSEKMVENLLARHPGESPPRRTRPVASRDPGSRRPGESPPRRTRPVASQDLDQDPGLQHSRATPLVSILITGGFHTPDIAHLLKEKGKSYIVITPKITKIDSEKSASYLSIFSRDKTPLDKLFSGEKLFVSPTEVNMSPRLITHLAASIALLASSMSVTLIPKVGINNIPVPLYVASLVPSGYTQVEPLMANSAVSGFIVQAQPHIPIKDLVLQFLIEWGPSLLIGLVLGFGFIILLEIIRNRYSSGPDDQLPEIVPIESLTAYPSLLMPGEKIKNIFRDLNGGSLKTITIEGDNEDNQGRVATLGENLDQAGDEYVVLHIRNDFPGSESSIVRSDYRVLIARADILNDRKAEILNGTYSTGDLDFALDFSARSANNAINLRGLRVENDQLKETIQNWRQFLVLYFEGWRIKKGKTVKASQTKIIRKQFREPSDIDDQLYIAEVPPYLKFIGNGVKKVPFRSAWIHTGFNRTGRVEKSLHIRMNQEGVQIDVHQAGQESNEINQDDPLPLNKWIGIGSQNRGNLEFDHVIPNNPAFRFMFRVNKDEDGNFNITIKNLRANKPLHIAIIPPKYSPIRVAHVPGGGTGGILYFIRNIFPTQNSKVWYEENSWWIEGLIFIALGFVIGYFFHIHEFSLIASIRMGTLNSMVAFWVSHDFDVGVLNRKRHISHKAPIRNVFYSFAIAISTVALLTIPASDKWMLVIVPVGHLILHFVVNVIARRRARKKQQKINEEWVKMFSNWNRAYNDTPNDLFIGEEGHLKTMWIETDMEKGIGSVQNFDLLKIIMAKSFPRLDDLLSDHPFATDEDVNLMLDVLLDLGLITLSDKAELLAALPVLTDMGRRYRDFRSGLVSPFASENVDVNALRQNYFDHSSKLFSALIVLIPKIFDMANPQSGRSPPANLNNYLQVRRGTGLQFSFKNGFVVRSPIDNSDGQDLLALNEETVKNPVLYLQNNPHKIIEIFELATEHNLSLGTNLRWAMWQSREALANWTQEQQNLITPSNEWKEASASFIKIMRHTGSITHQIWEMDRLGLFEAFVPAYAKVKNLPSNAKTHQFPVGQHTLYLFKMLDELLETEYTYFEYGKKLRKELGSDEILKTRLSILFHDLGKRPDNTKAKTAPDHAIIASQYIAPEALAQLSVEDETIQSVVWLIRNHMVWNSYARDDRSFDERKIFLLEKATSDPSMTSENVNSMYMFSLVDGLSVQPWRGRNDDQVVNLGTIHHEIQDYLESSEYRREEDRRRMKADANQNRERLRNEFLAEHKESLLQQLLKFDLNDYFESIYPQSKHDLVSKLEIESRVISVVYNEDDTNPFFNRLFDTFDVNYLNSMSDRDMIYLMLFLIHLDLLKENNIKDTLVLFPVSYNLGYEKQFELIVGASFDQPRMVANITGALLAHEFSIQGAAVHTSQDDIVVDRFYGFFRQELESEETEVVMKSELSTDISQLLNSDQLQSLRSIFERRGVINEAHPQIVQMNILVQFLNDQDINGHAVSVLHVEMPDFDGLFHAISLVIAELGFNLEIAPVQTHPTLASDMFFVTRNGQPLNKVEKRILAEELANVLSRSPIDFANLEIDNPFKPDTPPTTASTKDDWARQKFSKDGKLTPGYYLYTILGVNWEMIYQLPVIVAHYLVILEPASIAFLAIAMAMWLVSAVNFGLAHKKDQTYLGFLGFIFAAPFALFPLFFPHLGFQLLWISPLASAFLHSAYNTMALIFGLRIASSLDDDDISPKFNSAILADGKSTRLFPFDKKSSGLLNTGQSLIESTVNRISGVNRHGNNYAIAMTDSVDAVRQLDTGLIINDFLTLEEGGNFFEALLRPLIYLSVHDPDTLLHISNGDIYIPDEKLPVFEDAMKAAATVAEKENAIATLGSPPTDNIEVWLRTGNMRIGDGMNGVFPLEEFKEKPSEDQARQMRGEKEKWRGNPGFTVGTIEAIELAIKQIHGDDIFKKYEEAKAALKSGGEERASEIIVSLSKEIKPSPGAEPNHSELYFRPLTHVSSDESPVKRYVVEADIDWLDSGTWPALRQVVEKTGDNWLIGPQDNMTLDNVSGSIVAVKPNVEVEVKNLKDHVVAMNDDGVAMVIPVNRAEEANRLYDEYRKRDADQYLACLDCGDNVTIEATSGYVALLGVENIHVRLNVNKLVVKNIEPNSQPMSVTINSEVSKVLNSKIVFNEKTELDLIEQYFNDPSTSQDLAHAMGLSNPPSQIDVEILESNRQGYHRTTLIISATADVKTKKFAIKFFNPFVSHFLDFPPETQAQNEIDMSNSVQDISTKDHYARSYSYRTIQIESQNGQTKDFVFQINEFVDGVLLMDYIQQQPEKKKNFRKVKMLLLRIIRVMYLTWHKTHHLGGIAYDPGFDDIVIQEQDGQPHFVFIDGGGGVYNAQHPRRVGNKVKRLREEWANYLPPLLEHKHPQLLISHQEVDDIFRPIMMSDRPGEDTGINFLDGSHVLTQSHDQKIIDKALQLGQSRSWFFGLPQSPTATYLIQYLLSKKTKIVFSGEEYEVPKGANAVATHKGNIVLDRALREASPEVILAHIIHEGSHIWINDKYNYDYETVQLEELANHLEVRVWRELSGTPGIDSPSKASHPFFGGEISVREGYIRDITLLTHLNKEYIKRMLPVRVQQITDQFKTLGISWRESQEKLDFREYFIFGYLIVVPWIFGFVNLGKDLPHYIRSLVEIDINTVLILNAIVMGVFILPYLLRAADLMIRSDASSKGLYSYFESHYNRFLKDILLVGLIVLMAKTFLLTIPLVVVIISEWQIRKIVYWVKTNKVMKKLFSPPESTLSNRDDSQSISGTLRLAWVLFGFIYEKIIKRKISFEDYKTKHAWWFEFPIAFAITYFFLQDLLMLTYPTMMIYVVSWALFFLLHVVEFYVLLAIQGINKKVGSDVLSRAPPAHWGHLFGSALIALPQIAIAFYFQKTSPSLLLILLPISFYVHYQLNKLKKSEAPASVEYKPFDVALAFMPLITAVLVSAFSPFGTGGYLGYIGFAFGVLINILIRHTQGKPFHPSTYLLDFLISGFIVGRSLIGHIGNFFADSNVWSISVDNFNQEWVLLYQIPFYGFLLIGLISLAYLYVRQSKQDTNKPFLVNLTPLQTHGLIWSIFGLDFVSKLIMIWFFPDITSIHLGYILTVPAALYFGTIILISLLSIRLVLPIGLVLAFAGAVSNIAEHTIFRTVTDPLFFLDSSPNLSDLSLAIGIILISFEIFIWLVKDKKDRPTLRSYVQKGRLLPHKILVLLLSFTTLLASIGIVNHLSGQGHIIPNPSLVDSSRKVHRIAFDDINDLSRQEYIRHIEWVLTFEFHEARAHEDSILTPYSPYMTQLFERDFDETFSVLDELESLLPPEDSLISINERVKLSDIPNEFHIPLQRLRDLVKERQFINSLGNLDEVPPGHALNFMDRMGTVDLDILDDEYQERLNARWKNNERLRRTDILGLVLNDPEWVDRFIVRNPDGRIRYSDSVDMRSEYIWEAFEMILNEEDLTHPSIEDIEEYMEGLEKPGKPDDSVSSILNAIQNEDFASAINQLNISGPLDIGEDHLPENPDQDLLNAIDKILAHVDNNSTYVLYFDENARKDEIAAKLEATTDELGSNQSINAFVPVKVPSDLESRFNNVEFIDYSGTINLSPNGNVIHSQHILSIVGKQAQDVVLVKPAHLRVDHSGLDLEPMVLDFAQLIPFILLLKIDDVIKALRKIKTAA